MGSAGGSGKGALVSSILLPGFGNWYDQAARQMQPPKGPQAPQPGVIPSLTDPSVTLAAQQQQQLALTRQGRLSTIMTSPQGQLTPDTVNKKTLLGG